MTSLATFLPIVHVVCNCGHVPLMYQKINWYLSSAISLCIIMCKQLLIFSLPCCILVCISCCHHATTLPQNVVATKETHCSSSTSLKSRTSLIVSIQSRNFLGCLKFWDVELESYFPLNSMSLHRRIPHLCFAPYERIDNFTLNNKLTFRLRTLWPWLTMTTIWTTHVDKVISRDLVLGAHSLPSLHGYTSKSLLHVLRTDLQLIPCVLLLCTHTLPFMSTKRLPLPRSWKVTWVLIPINATWRRGSQR